MRKISGPRPIPAGTYGQCAKRLSIVEAAGAVFARDGFAGTSIDTIAAAACVSRQTVYNHYGDKETLFAEVVRDMTERSNTVLNEMVGSFPDNPTNLEAELTAFAERLVGKCICDEEARCLRRLVENEGVRYPELLTAWREHGPGKVSTMIAARLARLAHAGHLRIADPDLAARQFLALIHADLQARTVCGEVPPMADVAISARNGVRTFLAAFAPARAAAPAGPARTAPVAAAADA